MFRPFGGVGLSEDCCQTHTCMLSVWVKRGLLKRTKIGWPLQIACPGDWMPGPFKLLLLGKQETSIVALFFCMQGLCLISHSMNGVMKAEFQLKQRGI